jgi:hypothetical protein
MTQAEVEELLGGPPGNYGQYNGGAWYSCEGHGEPPVGAVVRAWHDDRNLLWVWFDGEGRVVGCCQQASYQQVPGKLQRIGISARRKLGLEPGPALDPFDELEWLVDY